MVAVRRLGEQHARRAGALRLVMAAAEDGSAVSHATAAVVRHGSSFSVDRAASSTPS
jgi:hypothetical protein